VTTHRQRGRPPDDDRRVITALEAEEQLGIPSGSIRGWATKQQLFPVSIGRDGSSWYLLAEVLKLAEATRRRAKHTRPSRRRDSEQA